MHKQILLLAACLCLGIQLAHSQTPRMEAYSRQRDALTAANSRRSFASDVILTADEQQVNDKLNILKADIYRQSQNGAPLPPSVNFHLVRKQIEASALYSAFLRSMPKGGLLHLHGWATTQIQWVVDTLVQLPNAYVCWQGAKKGTIEFTKTPQAGYELASKLHKQNKNFKNELITLLTLDPDVAGDPWTDFENCFRRIAGFVSYEPMFEPYYTKGLRDLIADHVQYVEIRTGLRSDLYTLDPANPPGSVIQHFLNIREKLSRQNPGFDMKVIYTGLRFGEVSEITQTLIHAYEVRKKYPDFVIGFDLVGDERVGHTTAFYLPAWLKMDSLDRHYGITMPLYLHDGESNMRTDTNLYDAVALNSRRIGHSINLYYFPTLQQEVINRDIMLEVSPISNQLLKYVPDLRTHPAIAYMNNGIPISISSDDPGVFNYQGLSYDFWEAVVAWDLNLAEVKKLCLNSMVYSGMNEKERRVALEVWQKRWDGFIKSQLGITQK